MNIEIARQRYTDVFLPDVIDNSQGDFLAKHVPMKNLYFTDHAELSDSDKKHPLNENEIFDTVFSGKPDDRFVLVKGASGAGKSHLIRWINTMLEVRKKDTEIILYIRRADNTLKGTIKQLIDLPDVKNTINTELYKKLSSASIKVPELELKNTVYYWFVNLIESDDGTAGEEEGERLLGNVDRKHLVALLQNSSFKDRLMQFNGPIDRIYSKFAENKTNDVNDKAAQFEHEDFEIDSSFSTELISSGADEKARKIAQKIISSEDFLSKIVIYINKFVEKVIQRCAGLEAGDLRDVVLEVRQELFKQNKSLIVLIEDITAASGVDDSLLDALLTNKSGYADKKLCQITSVVGVADGYYRDSFRTNTKGRIKQFITVPDEVFNGDTDGLVEFFARYLNTVSLDEETINEWVSGKALADAYPVHTVTLGDGWGEYQLGDKSINLFPFTRNAIMYLYKIQDPSQRNPRAIMRNIIEPYVKDALDNLETYPSKRTVLSVSSPKLQNLIYNLDLQDDVKIRLSHFMHIWGNGSDEIYTDNGIKYIAGIPEQVYLQLKLPLIDGTQVEKPSVVENVPVELEDVHTEETTVKDNEQVVLALKEVDKWIENKEYKLNIGATTKSVRALNTARKNINEYLSNVIDWISEGVSLDAVQYAGYTKAVGSKLVAFERQTMSSDAVILLPATIESRKIIEAFLRWQEEGKGSWDFPNSTDYLYRVQKWTERIKPEIIRAVMHYGDTKVDYFSYAVASEYYRLIFNGYCKKYQNSQNFSLDMILQDSPNVTEDNGHTKSWNDLKRMVSGSDGQDIRASVLQFYNLPQGNTFNSTNYEYDYLLFNKAVKKVTNHGLVYLENELQLDDPIKKRKLISEHLKKIVDRISIVVVDEKNAIESTLARIKNLIDIDEIDDEEDIKDIISSVRKFYKQAQDSHISVAVHVDNSLINLCNKNASSIMSALNNATSILETEDVIESLLKISRDPIASLQPFVRLLEGVQKDINKAEQEINNRMDGRQYSVGDESSEYCVQKNQISICKQIIEEVKNNANQ